MTHRSALRATDGPGRPEHDDLVHLIDVAIDEHRSPAAPPGVRLHHLAGFDEKVQWNASPPRVRVEQAVLDVAAEARTEMTCIATLADAVQARRTTAARLSEALAQRSRIARRDLMEGVLADIAHGTCSALEHAYLTRVERPHGLPTARRQPPITTGPPGYADVEYVDHGVRIELDGRMFHDNSRARDTDLERDLDAVLGATVTARLGWGQVYDRPCSTARKAGRLLRSRGWTGAVIPCPQCGEDLARAAS